MKHLRSILFLALLPLVFIGCKTGSPKDNEPPDTRIFVQEINLTGTNRLTTEVPMYWSGTDKDGYVVGYEISFDQTNWDFVTNTDSVFQFVISAGSDTVDIDFWVRAQDDAGDVDPTPAYLNIPIKNSPPTAIMDTVLTIPDTVYTVLTLSYLADDPDGVENLDSVFLKFNNGPWYGFDPSVSILTLVPQTPENTGAVTCDLYQGITAMPGNDVQGLELDADNVVYVRARDISGAESDVDTSSVFFVKRKTSDLLVVDSHAGGSSPLPEDIYGPILTNVYGSFDQIDLISNGEANLPQFWSPTFGFYLDLYDIVFWYADESTVGTTGSLHLEAASDVIQDYLNDGGKLLISAKFPSTFDNTSPITQFSPMDSLSSSGGQARIPTDSLCIPYGTWAGSLSNLQSSAFLTGVDPFYMKAGADTLYTANLTITGGWVGPNIVGARTTNANGNTNQVFFSLELHNLNGDPAALEGLFQEILNNEFNW